MLQEKRNPKNLIEIEKRKEKKKFNPKFNQ